MPTNEEKCPYCGTIFTDDGEYHIPGRVECPSCGADFDSKFFESEDEEKEG